MPYAIVICDCSDFCVNQFIGKQRGYKDLNITFAKYVLLCIKMIFGIKLATFPMIGGNSHKRMGRFWQRPFVSYEYSGQTVKYP